MTIRRLMLISTLIGLFFVLVLTGLTWRGFSAAGQAIEDENHQALPAQEVDEGEEVGAVQPVEVELAGRAVGGGEHDDALRPELVEEGGHDERVGHVGHLRGGWKGAGWCLCVGHDYRSTDTNPIIEQSKTDLELVEAEQVRLRGDGAGDLHDGVPLWPQVDVPRAALRGERADVHVEERVPVPARAAVAVALVRDRQPSVIQAGTRPFGTRSLPSTALCVS